MRPNRSSTSPRTDGEGPPRTVGWCRGAVAAVVGCAFALGGFGLAAGCAGVQKQKKSEQKQLLDGGPEGRTVGGLPLGSIEGRCGEGDGLACTVVGLHYLETEGTDPSGPAAEPLEEGCRAEEPVACGKLASMLVTAGGENRELGRALQLYRRGCRLGGAFACTGLARMFEQGVVVDESLERARTLHRHACRAGDPRGCYWYAEFERQQGRETAALPPYVASCAGGHDDACTALDSQYGLAMETADGRSKIVRQLDDACHDGSTVACVVLGLHYEQGRAAVRDLGRAAEMYRRGCPEDEEADASKSDISVWPRACSRLGALYENGGGVEADASRARELYARSCDLGYAVGCSYLGSMWERGEGGPQDRTRSLELFRVSCSRGHARSCYRMGRAAERGERVDEDLLRAALFYRVGCTSGEAGACNSLGVLFDEGRGVETDAQRAAEYYGRACRLGESKGCYNLAVAHRIGNGVERDRERALELFRRACQGGVEGACERLDVEQQLKQKWQE